MKCTTQQLFLLAGLVISPTLMAQQDTMALDHIQSSSVFNVGYRQLPSFSSADHNGKVTGYTIAVCNMIADKLRQYLRLNNLTIHYVPVNSSERFSTLNSRKINTDCGINTNAPERTSSMPFSKNYYTAKIRIISLHKNNIQSIADLKGRTMGLTGSSKGLLEFSKANREQHLNISTTTSAAIKDAFGKMTHNGSTAFFVGDILTWPLISHSKQPGLFSVSSGDVGNGMHYAVMIRGNDPQFVTFVNSMLKDFFTSPASAQLRKEWLPPWSCEKLKNPSPGSCQHSH